MTDSVYKVFKKIRREIELWKTIDAIHVWQIYKTMRRVLLTLDTRMDDIATLANERIDRQTDATGQKLRDLEESMLERMSGVYSESSASYMHVQQFATRLTRLENAEHQGEGRSMASVMAENAAGEDQSGDATEKVSIRGFAKQAHEAAPAIHVRGGGDNLYQNSPHGDLARVVAELAEAVANELERLERRIAPVDNGGDPMPYDPNKPLKINEAKWPPRPGIKPADLGELDKVEGAVVGFHHVDQLDEPTKAKLQAGADVGGFERNEEPLVKPSTIAVTTGLAINPTHEAANAFWHHWNNHGRKSIDGYYESTWGAINAALKVGGLHVREGEVIWPGKEADIGDIKLVNGNYWQLVGFTATASETPKPTNGDQG